MRVFACFAASLDGNIALEASQYVRISSDEDIRRLRALRDEADAILVGGQTFRTFPKVHRRLLGAAPPLHCILTRGSPLAQALPPESPLFATETPVYCFTPQSPDEAARQVYPATVQWRSVAPGQEVETILQTLADAGVQTLMLEGGGEVFRLFLDRHAVQELYLTLCPVLLGAGASPLVAGPRYALEAAPRLSLLNYEPVGSEVFLHFKIDASPGLLG